MSRFEKVICIVLDGVGVGEAPDAAEYGDAGSNSLGNTATQVGALRLPVLEQLGLGHITTIAGVGRVDEPVSCFGRMCPASAGKDSTTGHWELTGCVLDDPFPTYPNGFPNDIVDAFEQAIGRKVIGNCAASGTEIIQELGAEHLRTGHPIVYTSQDSVFQIAAHDSVCELDELYRICETARALLVPPHGVSRVIARPFTGEVGRFFRTPGRKDFSLPPVSPTVLDALVTADHKVVTIGKVADLFCGQGITRSVLTRNNEDGMRRITELIGQTGWDFALVNLVDFDTMWGHRNDARAYALGLEEFDSYLGGLLRGLGGRTLLIITSDHGNDPTTKSTDHSREYVPLIAYHETLKKGRDIGTRRTFADVAATIAENFNVAFACPGTSFFESLFV